MTTTLRDVRSVIELRAVLDEARRNDRRIAFVPTMGALHAGHVALMEAARDHGDLVMASCYVNPRQFGAGEDLERYPRTPERDAELAAAAGVDVLWRPADVDVYGAGDGHGTQLRAGPLGGTLEGAQRPGHFDGVVAVVARLLGAVQPDALLLGEKDFQQLVILRRLVTDLLLPVQVVGVPTVRERDGLALSSRNIYLSDDERGAAAAIPRALAVARARAASGERGAPIVVGAAREVLEREPSLQVDYLVAVDETTLAPVTAIDARTVLLVAVRAGNTRLIDNARLLPDPTHPDLLPEAPT